MHSNYLSPHSRYGAPLPVATFEAPIDEATDISEGTTRMFGLSRRERATKMAIKVADTLVSQFRIFGREVPDALWFNPYALGVLQTAMGVMLQLRFGDSLKPVDSNMCILDAYATLSRCDPEPIAKAVFTYATAKHSAFLEGVASGEKIVAVTVGSKHCDQDPDVMHAYAIADEMGSKLDFGRPGGNRRSRAGGWLMQKLFYTRLAKELGVES